MRSQTVPENPYEAARFEWNERYRSFITAKRNWQILAVVAVVVNALLGWGLLWQASQSRVVPYVVRVDEVGQTLVLGPATASNVADPQVIAWQLQHYVRDVRSVTADRSAQKRVLEAAYERTAGSATQFLNEHFRAQNPFEGMTKGTVSIEIRSVLRVGDASWKLEWRETHRGLDGRHIRDEDWTGQFTVRVEPPMTPEGLARNPLGFRVTHISWARQL